MAKRRKRRRMAFIERMNQIIKDNPNMAIEKVKTITETEVKKALRTADREEPHDREEHHRVFRDTLFDKNKTTKTETTTKPVATPAKAETKTVAKPKTTTTKAKPKTTTTKAKKSTTATKPTTKKRTTTKRTKKAK